MWRTGSILVGMVDSANNWHLVAVALATHAYRTKYACTQTTHQTRVEIRPTYAEAVQTRVGGLGTVHLSA